MMISLKMKNFFIMYIDIPESQNDTSECAFLGRIRDNDSDLSLHEICIYYISMIFILFILDLSFTWNVLRLNVYEDEGIVRELQIIKHGINEHIITLQVQVDQTNEHFEATSGNDKLKC